MRAITAGRPSLKIGAKQPRSIALLLHRQQTMSGVRPGTDASCHKLPHIVVVHFCSKVLVAQNDFLTDVQHLCGRAGGPVPVSPLPVGSPPMLVAQISPILMNADVGPVL